MPRNPLIAEVFYLSEDIEKWGSGLRRISQECKTAGVKVIFKKIKSGFVVTFYRPNITGIPAKEEEGKNVKDTVKDTVKMLSEKENKILEILNKEPKTTARMLAEVLKINLRNTKKYLSMLQEQGLLKRIGSDKSGRWEVILRGMEK